MKFVVETKRVLKYLKVSQSVYFNDWKLIEVQKIVAIMLNVISFILTLSVINSGLAQSDKLAKHIKIEEKIIYDLENYIESQTSVLEVMKKKLFSLKVEHFEALENPEKYMSNDLNKFLFTKRLTRDVQLLSNKTFEVASGFKSKVESYKEDKNLPTENDLILSALSIAHLQKDKHLKTNKLAKGFFGNVKRR